MKIKRLNSDTPIEKRRFIYSLVLPIVFLLIAFTVHLIQHIEQIKFTKLGVYPMQAEGLWGILFTPLIHGDWKHLYSNSVSMLVLATTLFYFYNKIAAKIFIFIYLLSGLGTWLAARESWHIGASGVIYGLAMFLIISGIIRKHIPLIAISLLVILFYGGLIWGAFPLKVDLPYSWEGHLWGAVTGSILALVYRREGPQKPKSPFEEEVDVEDYDGEEPYWMQGVDQDKNEDR